jgi:excisionase family DNA binding protein
MSDFGNKPSSVADQIEAFGRMMTAKELAPLLALDPKTMYAKAPLGLIPSIKLGGSLRFDSFEVAAWLRRKSGR